MNTYLDAVEGIDFRGCQWLNKMNSWRYKGMGKGILAVNSAFRVLPYCPSSTSPSSVGLCTYPQRSLFCGLTEGIYVRGRFSSDLTVYIDQADFDSCGIGEYVTTYKNVSTTRCNFTIGRGIDVDSILATVSSGCHQNAGIISHNSGIFRTEENNFFGKINGYSDWYNFGVVIANAGGYANKIYRNNFDTLTFGVFSIGNNQNSFDWDSIGAPPYYGRFYTGLQVRCNAFLRNITDIMITRNPGALDTFDGIGRDQGPGLAPTRTPHNNTFTGSTTNIDNDTWHDHYFDCYIPSGGCPAGNPLKDVWAGSTTVTGSCLTSFPSPYSTYPAPVVMSTRAFSPRPGPDPWLPYDVEFRIHKAAYESAKSTYKSSLDLGSTPSMVAAISTYTVAPSLYSMLGGVAPYLSSTAVKATADLGLLSYSQMLNVMLQNPDNLRDQSVIDYVNDLYTFSSADADTLVAHASYITSRTMTEDTLSRSRAVMDEDASYMLMAFGTPYNPEIDIYDTTGAGKCTDTTSIYYGIDSNAYYAGLDSIDTWWQNIGGLPSYYSRVGNYNFRRQRELANTLMNSIDDILPSVTPRPVDRAEYASYLTLWQAIKSAEDDGRGMFSLNSTELGSLGTVGLPELTANTADLLTRMTVGDYGDVIKYPRETAPWWGGFDPGIPCLGIAHFEWKHANPESGLGTPIVNINSNNKNRLSVYPNPASGIVTFDYNVPNGVSDLTIVITNMLGEKIATLVPGINIGKTLWDPKGISSGVYLYEAKSAGISISKGKLILTGK